MGDLTKNISRYELACRCGCGYNVADFETVNILQNTADHFGIVYQEKIIVDITGPNRCKEHNETVQKEYNPKYVPYSSKSPHINGGGVDFKLFRRAPNGRKKQIDPKKIDEYLDKKYPNRLGLGLYDNRNHLDPRTTMARWNKRRK